MKFFFLSRCCNFVRNYKIKSKLNSRPLEIHFLRTHSQLVIMFFFIFFKLEFKTAKQTSAKWGQRSLLKVILTKVMSAREATVCRLTAVSQGHSLDQCGNTQKGYYHKG